MELTRGANAPVDAPSVSLVLEWGSDREIDPQALLLTDTGKIRSNDDFVFFNAPRHPSGTVELEDAAPGRATVRLALDAIESDITRVVIAGSVEPGSFQDVAGLTLTIWDADGILLKYQLQRSEAVTAMVLGEFYRRRGEWKFRAVGQGWDSGLRGLAEEFGVEVDDEPAAAAPAPPPSSPPIQPPAPSSPSYPAPDSSRIAGWYSTAGDGSRVRWWNGSAWTQDYRPAVPGDDPNRCARCGQPKRVPRFGVAPPCRACESEVNSLLESWRAHAWQVLLSDGPRGPRWDELWERLRFHMISDVTGREALRPLAVAYLERVVAFAFADGEVEHDELDEFERAIVELQMAVDLGAARAHIDQLRRRMLRGRSLTQVKVGDLPRVERPDLHLEADELLYLDVNATQIRYLAGGPKFVSGRLIGSSRKLRFVGNGAGTELAWARMVSIRNEYDTVVIEATTARGGGTYRVPDSEYVAAVLEGALRVAKRLVLAPGTRDTRAIAQDVKSRVWQRDGGRCVQCSDDQYLEFDHIIPWSRGGATSVDNLQILCRSCNLQKGARI
ncbi:TerD family protein [Nocardia jejuensis]|uniref:TerD family protein n=1 Tax=Nocardia jejuensis TaxID=328049 RepID=UPI001FE10294|nr:TerD family protein [Nocardia jejuensis]